MVKRKHFLSLCISLSLLICGSVCSSKDGEPDNSGDTKAEGQAAKTPITVVLFHGLGASNRDFEGNDGLKKLIETNFGEKVNIVAPNRNTLLSIEEQAKKVRKEIKGDGKEQKKFVFIGMSQGGTLALEVLRQMSEASKKRKKKSNQQDKVMCVVTIASPINKKGVPAIKKAELAKQAMQKIKSNSGIPDAIKGEVEKLSGLLTSLDESVPGISDLAPNSEFLERLTKYLRKNNRVPILAIAAKENGIFEKYLDKVAPDFSSKELLTVNGEPFTLPKIMDLILGSPKHDLMIPTASQLPPEGTPGVIQKTISNTAHKDLGGDSLIFSNPEAIQTLVGFVGKNLKPKTRKRKKK